MFDGKAFGEEMVEIVRGYVDRATAPLITKIGELERDLAAAKAADHSVAIRAAVAEAVAALPAPENGKDADPAIIRQMVDEAVAAIPPAEPGKDADPGVVQRMVDEAVAKLPPARDGKDADPDVTAEMVRDEVEKAIAAIPKPKDGRSVSPEELVPLIEERLSVAVAEAVAAVPLPKDGVGLAGAVIDRDGNLALTLTDGSIKALGRVVGRDVDDHAVSAHIKELVDAIPRPKDGVDGVGFDDLDLVETEEGISLSFTRAGVAKEFPLPVVVDRGVFKEDGSYRKGNGVTWGGSFWIAQKDAPEGKPDSQNSGWRLAVKRGQNGKDAGK